MTKQQKPTVLEKRQESIRPGNYRLWLAETSKSLKTLYLVLITRQFRIQWFLFADVSMSNLGSAQNDV